MFRILRSGTVAALLIFCMILSHSCKTTEKKKLPDHFSYAAFKDSILQDKNDTVYETQNILDSSLYNPSADTIIPFLKRYDSLWRSDIAVMQKIDTLIKLWKKTDKYSAEELDAIKVNQAILDSFLNKSHADEHSGCKEKECLVFAEIIKSKQVLYLYLDGTLIDSFAVSTGMPKYETPAMSVRPHGPLFTKYKSKKFPGGNYMGLGNMPYAVFIRGGYAIHGTTTGNFKKLGKKASHGCIRLHPVNAKIFYALVKRIGIDHTWVTIKE
ncbi:MAG: L,D-transpeptidase [Ferruginibacter sp.]